MQAAVMIGFGNNAILNLDCLFVVLEKEQVPHQRSGITLGQATVLDRMHYRILPRRVIRTLGERIDDASWGDTGLEAFADVNDKFAVS